MQACNRRAVCGAQGASGFDAVGRGGLTKVVPAEKCLNWCRLTFVSACISANQACPPFLLAHRRSGGAAAEAGGLLADGRAPQPAGSGDDGGRGDHEPPAPQEAPGAPVRARGFIDAATQAWPCSHYIEGNWFMQAKWSFYKYIWARHIRASFAR